MIAPARAPRPTASEAPRRFVRVDARMHAVTLHARVALPEAFIAGDLLVFNDAATLPASLRARTERGEELELRLAGPLGADGAWPAVAFGAGDWRARTEDRPAPPALTPGAVVLLGDPGADVGSARVVAVDTDAPRLVRLAFDGAPSGPTAPYRAGRPVQYSHLAAPLDLWDAQTPFAGRPWAVEPPSAGFAFDVAMLLALRRRGVAFARVTHAAGLSSTGDPVLDARLPLPERYEIPRPTVRAVARARRHGGRVVAIGTTVARALEGAAAATGGRLVASCGITPHRLGPGVTRRIVDGLWSGLHARGTSHFELGASFASTALLARALDEAERAGFVGEEFGDGMLLLGHAAGTTRGMRRR